MTWNSYSAWLLQIQLQNCPVQDALYLFIEKMADTVTEIPVEPSGMDTTIETTDSAMPDASLVEKMQKAMKQS